MKLSYKRAIFYQLQQRMAESRRFIQVVSGPRQVGKTTAVHQFLDEWPGGYHYATADLPAPPQPQWIEIQWEIARNRAASGTPVVLALDEVQKVSRWSEVVKSLWDEDSRLENDIRVIILGSSALLMQAGLTESLAGRFELLHATHWQYSECRECFSWNLESYIYFGGYPGAAVLIDDQERWARFIRDSLIETTISKDILLLNRIHKPSLLRQLFMLAAEYSGQIVSYQKFLGQLHDAGNTTTLAAYQHLLENAQLIKGLPKWSGKAIRRRASSPKWLVLNTALMTAIGGLSFEHWRNDPKKWGRLVESVVGAHLVNTTLGKGIKVYYWRDRNREVDFVLHRSDRLLALEVKSGLHKRELQGLNAFQQRFPGSKSLLIGRGGISLEEFMSRDAAAWLD